MCLKSCCKPQMARQNLGQLPTPNPPTPCYSTSEGTPRDKGAGSRLRCQFLHLARHHTNLSCFQNAVVGYWVCGDNKLLIVIVQNGVHGLPCWGIGDIVISDFEYGDFNVGLVLRHSPMVLQSKEEDESLMTSQHLIDEPGP